MTVGTSELPAPGTSSVAEETMEVPSGFQSATEVLAPFQVHSGLGSTTTASTFNGGSGSAESEVLHILAGPSELVPFQRWRVSALRPTWIIKDYPWM